MIKKLNIKKIIAILSAGFTLISISGCSKKIDKTENDNSSSYQIDKDYELIKIKDKLSDELIKINESYDIGLVDYINNYTNFQDDFIPYDPEVDECNYFNKLPEFQRKIIYKFAYDYKQYLKYYHDKDSENAKKYIVRMVNDKREFGNMRCNLIKTLPKELNVKDDDQIVFTPNYIGPLEQNNDYNDYISFLYMYNPIISKKINKLSINYKDYDSIDMEIAQFTLFLHLYMKYTIDPLQIVELENGKYYLCNQEDFDKFIEKNKDNYESDYLNQMLKNFVIEKRINSWILKSNDKVFKKIESNDLIEKLNYLSLQYNKTVFNYEEMKNNDIIKSIFCNNFIQDKKENRIIENYWWPIGSTEIEKIDGIEFARKIPEETFAIDKFGFIAGKNGVGVTNIIASKSGEVIYPKSEDETMYENGSTECSKYGNYVIIKHNDGNYTLYGHLSQYSINVFAGDYVEQGQVIGKMGKSGNAFDTYLKFEIRLGENSENAKVNINDYVSIDYPREEPIIESFQEEKSKIK